jgi:fibronectin-binding autotransporter adhesin
MKPLYSALVALTLLPLTPLAQTEFVWSGVSSNSFNTGTNWEGGVSPGTTTTPTTSTNTDVAVFDNAAQAGPIVLGSAKNLGGFRFAGPNVGAYQLASTNTNRFSMTLGGSVTMDSQVANAQSIQRLGFTGSTGSYTISNDAALSTAVFSVPSSIISYTTGTATLFLDGSNTGANELNNISQNAGAGALSVVKNSAGTWVLAGSNPYSGGTTVNAGLLGIRGSAAVGTGTLTVNGGAIAAVVSARTISNSLDVNGNFTAGGTIPSLSSSVLTINGGVDLKGGTREITTLNSLALGGVISNGGLVKKGSDSLTLSAANTYTGATEVEGGTLFVNGSLANASVVTVGSDGILAGNGTINGATSIAGEHRPGATANSRGQQTFAGSLTYNESAQIYWDLGANSSASAGSNFDQVVVGGNLNFNGATAITLSFATGVTWSDAFWNSDQSWTVYSVGGLTTGFSNLALTTANWVDSTAALFNTARPGASFSLIQSGEDVVLAYAIPEPATYAVLLGLGSLGAAV